MITTTELLKRTAIGNRRTLLRWQQAGLIPPPRIGPCQSGRGRTSHWPDWVLPRCRRILELRKDGYSLAAILESLGTDWKAENDRWKLGMARKKLLRAVGQRPRRQLSPIKLRRRFAKLVWQRVNDSVRDAVDETVLYFSLTHKLEQGASLDQALQYARDGCSPFLVFNGYEMRVIPDFAVSKYLHEYALDRLAYVTVSLLPILRKICPHENLPDEPSHSPNSQVTVKVGNSTIPRKFQLLDDGRKTHVDQPSLAGASLDGQERRKMLRGKNRLVDKTEDAHNEEDRQS